MGYYRNRNLNEELTRINEIIVGNSPEILTEQPKVPAGVRKSINDATGGMFTPEGMKKMFAKMGLDGLDAQMVKFVDNFDALRVLANTEGGWDDMISRAMKVYSEVDIFDAATGKLLSVDETARVMKNELESLLDGSKYISKTRYYQLVKGKWVKITQEAFEDLKKVNSTQLFNDLPYYLRHSEKEIMAALEGVRGGGLKTVDEFLVALRGFMRGGTAMTPDLKIAIIALMSNTDGFAKQISKGLIANNKFYQFVKLYRATGKMEIITEAMSEALGLVKTSKLLDDLDVLMSKEGVLIGEWFDFVFQSFRPFKAINKLRFGITTSRFRTFASDIVMGSFFDYVMGAQILKSIRRLVKLPVFSLKGASVASSILLMYIFVGGYKTIRDWNIKDGFDPRKTFQSVMSYFSQYCAGDNKTKDALTGSLYNNVVGDKSDAEGTRTSCGPVEFNTAFLKTYTADKDNPKYKPADVKAIAETLYLALNIDSYEDHPMSIFRDTEGRKIPWTTITLQVPSLTKIFREYTGMFTADNDIVQNILEKDGMDIIKLSQISSYYEKTFNASLLEDMTNLNYWSQFTNGMDFDGAEVAIEDLPYLDPGQGDLNYDTWKEVVDKNKTLFLRYPTEIAYEADIDGDMMMVQIKIAKCGNNCVDLEDNKCKCNDGGCNLANELVSLPMGVALEKSGYTTQEQLNSLCKQPDGFTVLEGIFNEAHNKDGTGCVLRRGRFNSEVEDDE